MVVARSARSLVVSGLTLASVLMSCSSSSEPSTRLPVELVDDALRVAEEKFGDGTQFFEINVTDVGVNLFVRTHGDSGESSVQSARYTTSGELFVSTDRLAADGPVFVADDVDFDEGTITLAAERELPNSTPEMLIITASAAIDGAPSAVEYRVVMNSERGGRLIVLLSRDGRILGSDFAE